MEDNLPDAGPKRRWGKRHVFGTVLLFLLILLLAAWWQRTDIADRFVQRQLEQYDVRASYEIQDIGFRTQRLRNVVLGATVASTVRFTRIGSARRRSQSQSST